MFSYSCWDLWTCDCEDCMMLLQSAASTISFQVSPSMRGPSSMLTGLLWLLHAICFTCCWKTLEGRVTSTLDSSLKSKQSSPVNTLTELTRYDDKPNPRLSCSKGMARARHLVEQKFETLGLKPMGSEGFRFTVPETKDEQCPDGITSLIAVVEGNDETLKDEYLGCLVETSFS